MDDTYFFRVQIAVFSFMGIHLLNAQPTKDRQWLTAYIMTLLCIMVLPLLSGVIKYLTNVSVMTDAMGALLACILTIIKYALFHYYRKDFVGLIHRLRGKLQKEISVWPEAAAIFEAENRSDQLLSGTYTRCFVLAGVFAAIKPFVIMTVAYFRLGSTHLELPYLGVYPWDYQIIWYYIPTYILNINASYCAVTMSLCVDTLLFAFTYNVCAIFKIAKQRVIDMPAMADAPKEELSALIQILQLHKEGLHMAQEVSDNFRPLIFMQFFISALQLCFIGFQAADLFPKPQATYFMVFMGSILIALFLYSQCGENIKKASMEFADGIYESNWTEFAPSTKKALLIASMRARRPCQMKAYIFEANMATYTTIVRSAMSYIMMLRSFNV